MTLDWKIEKIDYNDIFYKKGIVELAKQAFENDWSESFEWKYLKNPFGQAFGYVAIFQDEIIGSLAMFPQKINNYGKMISGIQLGDVMASPKYRGHGARVVTSLLRHAREEAKDKKYEFGIGFPGQLSYLLLTKLGKWQDIGEISSCLTLVFPLRFFFKKSNLIHIKNVDNFTQEYDVFWDKVKEYYGFTTHRSSEYLNWRYIKNK